MFKFPESNKIHFQCDVILCKTNCPQLDCNSELKSTSNDSEQSKDWLQLLASTTALVFEPGEQTCESFPVYQTFMLLTYLHLHSGAIPGRVHGMAVPMAYSPLHNACHNAVGDAVGQHLPVLVA